MSKHYEPEHRYPYGPQACAEEGQKHEQDAWGMLYSEESDQDAWQEFQEAALSYRKGIEYPPVVDAGQTASDEHRKIHQEGAATCSFRLAKLGLEKMRDADLMTGAMSIPDEWGEIIEGFHHAAQEGDPATRKLGRFYVRLAELERGMNSAAAPAEYLSHHLDRAEEAAREITSEAGEAPQEDSYNVAAEMKKMNSRFAIPEREKVWETKMSEIEDGIREEQGQLNQLNQQGMA